jgi:hypothetical protein
MAQLLEQPDLKILLKVFDDERNRRLANAEALGRLGKTLDLGNRGKNF